MALRFRNCNLTRLGENGIAGSSILEVAMRSHGLGHILEMVTYTDKIITLGRISFTIRGEDNCIQFTLIVLRRVDNI